MDGWVSIDVHLGSFRFLFFFVGGGWNFMLVFLEDLWVYLWVMYSFFWEGRVGIHACINLYP